MPKHKLHQPQESKKQRRTTPGSSRTKIHKRQKTVVTVIYGGPSVEHEVSLWSAKNVASACLDAGFSVQVIYAKRDGQWIYAKQLLTTLLNKDSASLLEAMEGFDAGEHVELVPARGLRTPSGQLETDVIFSTIHGTGGEDGVLQGALELAQLPYVGCSVLTSAICMDKVVTKMLAASIGIPIVDYLVATKSERPGFANAKHKLSLPMFVKPASLGSSIGVHKVHTAAEYKRALDEIFILDRKVLIERAVSGREVECSILGRGRSLIVSGVGEVATSHEFFSFEAKYLDEHGVVISVPAQLPKKIITQIQKYSEQISQICNLEGLARIDFFYDEKQGNLFLNEVNTLPGFTALSMYPRLWAAQGYSATELVTALIEDALSKELIK